MSPQGEHGNAEGKKRIRIIGGKGDGRQIQQVAVVGVHPHIAVGCHRRCGHLLPGIGPAAGRHNENRTMQQSIGLLLVFTQLMLRSKDRSRIVALLLGGAEDGLRYGKNLPRVGFHKPAQVGPAFRDPRTVVQNGRYFTEQAAVDVFHRDSALLQPFCRLVPGAAVSFLIRPVECQRLLGQQQLPRFDRRDGCTGMLPAFLPQLPPDYGIHQICIVQGVGKYSDTIKAGAGRYNSAYRPIADGGLVADKIVQRSGDSAGAGGIRSKGEDRLASGYRNRRSGAGASADQLLLQGIPGFPVGAAGAHQPGGELVQIGFAKRNGSRFNKLLHNSGAPVRGISEGRASGCCRHICQIDIVFNGEGNPP
ncbi:hypothetical protein D3C75_757180 [compost metagenome]